jgi:hypothetical protein
MAPGAIDATSSFRHFIGSHYFRQPPPLISRFHYADAEAICRALR